MAALGIEQQQLVRLIRKRPEHETDMVCGPLHNVARDKRHARLVLFVFGCTCHFFWLVACVSCPS